MRFFRYFIIFLLCGVNVSLAQNYDDQAKKLDSEIKRIEKLQAEDKKNQDKTRKELNKINAELKGVRKELKSLESELKNQSELVTSLAKKTSENQVLSEDAKNFLSVLLIQSTKQQKPNFIQMLLSQTDINQLDRQQTYLKYYAMARQQQIEKLRISLQNNEQTSREYIERQKQLEEKYKQQKQLQEKMDQQNKEKNKLIKQLESGIAEKSTTIEKLKEDKKRLAALIKRLEEQRKLNAAKDREFIPAKGGFIQQKGRLLLPIAGKVRIAYGQRNGASGLSSNGLEIGASQAGNNPVRAIYEGRVIFSNWLKGFGNLIIIEHGNGYLSLYGNNQVLNKKEGDVVAARETIATYNQQNQTTMYFEMRYQGKPINPQTWLRK